MITVLGASGFIGHRLHERLGELNIERYAPARDERLSGKHLGDVIYCIGLTGDFRSRPFDTVAAHVSKLLEVLRDCDFDSLLYLSSTRLYDAAENSTAEENPLRVAPMNPGDLYNISKAMGESIALNCGHRTRVARISNVYGADFSSHNFLSTIIREALKGRIVLQTSAASVKDYVSVDDVVDGLIDIATRGREQIYNLASGVNVSNGELVESLRSLTGCAIEFSQEAQTVRAPPISIERLRKEFNFTPSLVLDDMANLLEVYRCNEDLPAFISVDNHAGSRKSEKIPVFKPLIEEEELKANRRALEMGWLGMGSYVGEFEEGLRSFLGASDRYVAAVSTGHAAIHLGLLTMGVGPGDEVITPSFNNAADFQAILATGAQPVFCDIDEDSLCIDLDKAEELVSPQTKAIIAMDYDCVLCDHDRVAAFAKEHSLRVLHDAAHSFGSKYKGQMVGSFSDVCMFSFDPVKTITCIDGGAVVVRTEEELRTLHEMRLIGMSQPTEVMYTNARAWTYDMRVIGFRYHMANLHAATGLAQLAKMEKISASRRAACRYYSEHLGVIEEVVVPKTDFDDLTPFLYYIRVSGDQRDSLRGHLLEQGIDTGIHWKPGHWFTLLKNCRRGDLSVTDRVAREVVSLPLHSLMTTDTLDRVIEGIESFFKN